MRPFTIALAATGIGLAATLAGITLGPVLGGWAATVAVAIGLTGGAVLAVLCWRSCHLNPSTPEAI